MPTVNALVIQPIADAELAQIASLDPRLRVVDARGWFDDEYRETWPKWSVDRYLGTRSGPPSTRAERDRLLAEAEVILGGWPFPLDSGRGRHVSSGFISVRPAPATCCAATSGAAASSSPPRAASATRAPWPSTCWRASSTLRAACTGLTATGSASSSSTARIGQC